MGQMQRRKRLDREYHGIARRKVVNQINPYVAAWGFVAAQAGGFRDALSDVAQALRDFVSSEREFRRLHLQEWGDFVQPKGEA